MKQLKIIITLFLAFFVLASSPSPSQAISAKGAILLEQHSGRVLYEKNAHTPMRIASITKIMTAILAIESGKLDDTVTISNKAAGTEGSSLYLLPGEKVKLNDLVYGLMLRSGNDAAVAIAEHVAGSLDSFIIMMNKKAKELGMKQTVFANPHGLDDHENHYSTAYDMALLTRYAMNNETYAKISGTKSYTANSLSKHGTVTWRNKNRLLTQLYPYSTGGKTGYTQRAKRTLVSTASKDGLNLIAVTINDRNDWKDHMRLFDQAFSEYKFVKIVSKDSIPNLFDDYHLNMKIEKEFSYPLTTEEMDFLQLKLKQIKPDKRSKANKDKELQVGKIEVLLKESLIGEVSLYMTEIPQSKSDSWWDKIKKAFPL